MFMIGYNSNIQLVIFHQLLKKDKLKLLHPIQQLAKTSRMFSHSAMSQILTPCLHTSDLPVVTTILLKESIPC